MSTHPEPKLKAPSVLANGFIYILHQEGYVLAKDDHQYVTWRLTPDGHTVHGNYFPHRSFGGEDEARKAAMSDFLRRCRQNRR